MATIPHRHRPSNLHDWLEAEHTRTFIEDQQRHPWGPRDTRTPCANPDCPTLCEGAYCCPACEAADTAVIEDMARRWERQLLAEGCQRVYYANDTGRVLLGNRNLADHQRTADDAAGGLVFLACHRGGHS